MSCPPPDFLETSNLENFKKAMNPDRSILVINLVCRNVDLKKHYINVVQQQFPLILQCDVPSEVNTLLFCFTKNPDVNLKNISTHIYSSIKLICHTDNAIPSQSNKNNLRESKQKKVVDYFDGAFDDIDTIASSFKVLKV